MTTLSPCAQIVRRHDKCVMAGLVPAIHVRQPDPATPWVPSHSSLAPEPAIHPATPNHPDFNA